MVGGKLRQVGGGARSQPKNGTNNASSSIYSVIGYVFNLCVFSLFYGRNHRCRRRRRRVTAVFNIDCYTIFITRPTISKKGKTRSKYISRTVGLCVSTLRALHRSSSFAISTLPAAAPPPPYLSQRKRYMFVALYITRLSSFSRFRDSHKGQR